MRSEASFRQGGRCATSSALGHKLFFAIAETRAQAMWWPGVASWTPSFHAEQGWTHEPVSMQPEPFEIGRWVGLTREGNVSMTACAATMRLALYECDRLQLTRCYCTVQLRWRRHVQNVALMLSLECPQIPVGCPSQAKRHPHLHDTVYTWC